MTGRLAAAFAAVALLTAGCTERGGSPAAQLSRARRATPGSTAPAPVVSVVPAPAASGPAPVEYLADRSLYLAGRSTPVQLDQPPHPALQGTLAPLVVPSPDGRTLAYTTFTPLTDLDPSKPPSARGVAPGDALGIPSVRLHDLATGAERSLGDGTYSAAWRPSDGALAYVEGSEPPYRANTEYLGQVDVDGEQWTVSDGRYIVAAWAGSTLLVYHDAGNESFDLEAVDGPAEVRTLAPTASLIALSPDGRLAAVATSANGRSSDVEILDITSGDTLSSLTTGGLTSLVYGGSWVGSRLVARGGDADGSVVDVFNVDPDGRSLRIQQVLRIDPHLPNGLASPQLDSRDTNRLTAWSFLPDSRAYVIVHCDLATATCQSGPPILARVVRLFPG